MNNHEGASMEEAVTKAKAFLEEKRQPKRWSQDQKERQSARLTEYYKTHPEKRAELSERIQASWTKERKKEFGKQMRRVLARKEVREKISKGVKEHWRLYHEWREQHSE